MGLRLDCIRDGEGIHVAYFELCASRRVPSMHGPALGSHEQHRGDAEALEAGSLAARPLGRVLRSINGANELWLAVALSAEPCQNLPPPLLAAVVAALVAPEVSVL